MYIVIVGRQQLHQQQTKRLPDNLVNLTKRGRRQATHIGHRVEALLRQHVHPPCTRVHLIVSPFERALQTASCMRTAFEHRIVRTDIESRIREQEMGE